MPMIPLQDVLDNNTALSYFIGMFEGKITFHTVCYICLNFCAYYFTEFIGWAGGQEYLFFWLAIEVKTNTT